MANIDTCKYNNFKHNVPYLNISVFNTVFAMFFLKYY